MSTVTKIRIGTRKSPLALAQAAEVAELLAQAWPHLAAPGAIETLPMMTSGDAFSDRPLAEAGGKGLFTKEIEEALLDNRIDIAVHSMKDMPTMLPDGLTIGCMLEREDPRDMLVGEGLRDLSGLPKGAIFGTSSLRRAAMVKLSRPDVTIVPFRGNVETRLKKLAEGQAQATLLAMAGLNRLKRFDVPGHPLPWEEFLPAVAQGAIGIECRADDDATLDLIAPLAHIETEIAVLCERAFLGTLDG
ncbi:MAG: hydroxymethylbilane synthase, partial [Alphaproteobacteria bacterium]|nr:hydroxymethylbilane synthase [Alphaproteobacteria bacterium]